MKKLLTLIAAFYVAAFIAACGGGNAGTPLLGGGGGGGGGCTPASSASGSGGGTGCPTASALTLNLDVASIQNTGAQTVKATATATTASGQTLAGIPVTFSVDNNATFTTSGTSTAADGTVTATVGMGSDPSNRVITVTATSGSLSVAKSFAVTGASLTGTRVPAVVAPSSTGNRVDFRLVDANGKALGGVAFSVAAGALPTAAGTTGVNGDFSYAYTAPATTGSLDVVATAGGVTNTQTVQVQSTSVAPAVGPITSASVSANPSVVSTNATAATNNQTQIRALFVGTSNAPIANVRVRFDLNGDPNSIGGTFSTDPNIVYSDANGVAASAYTPGSRSSPTNGVTIRACYDVNDFAAGTCPNQTTTTITVVADALSVSIGSNNLVGTGSQGLTYTRQFVVLVVDASGAAKANVNIVPSIDLDRYWKGSYTQGATAWVPNLNPGGCANEDLNRNGILEAGEDINHSGAIEPRKSDVAITIVGGGQTDASGKAVVQIEYPQNVATWAQVKILVAATGVAGTEGRATWTEILPAPAAAVTNLTVAPPFIVSPYGVVYFAEDPTAPPAGYPPHTTFPDGTPITPGIIADPCKNPF